MKLEFEASCAEYSLGRIPPPHAHELSFFMKIINPTYFYALCGKQVHKEVNLHSGKCEDCVRQKIKPSKGLPKK